MGTGNRVRIGIVGFGYIGSYVYQQVTGNPELGLEVVFVCDKIPERLARLPREVILKNPKDFAVRKPDLVVEMAHPSVTQAYGVKFLSAADYMPLSLTALADAALYSALEETARKNQTCLYIPHGAVVGLESLNECREIWEEVKVTMQKNPRNLDFGAATQFKALEIKEATVLYDGPTRGICPLFPRNVNAHAAVAIGGIGFDKTRSVLIADPKLDVSIIEIEAHGQGVKMKIQRSNPLKGVSGIFTQAATLACIRRAKARKEPIEIC